MQYLMVLVLWLQLSVLTPSIAPIVPPGAERQHASTHHIKMEDVVDAAGCSATAVGPHTILTAGHCFVPSHTVVIDDSKVTITAMDWDENDHLLLTVNETFNAWLSIEERDLLPNETVHYWGNPGHSRDVYRIGVFERNQDEMLNWFVAPGAPGDSGSGILDASGKIIGVLSIGNQSGEVGAFVFAFTPAQLNAIK